ncbi:hypothetical protein SprV_0100301500 [Sparganum proliferum]
MLPLLSFRFVLNYYEGLSNLILPRKGRTGPEQSDLRLTALKGFRIAKTNYLLDKVRKELNTEFRAKRSRKPAKLATANSASIVDKFVQGCAAAVSVDMLADIIDNVTSEIQDFILEEAEEGVVQQEAVFSAGAQEAVFCAGAQEEVEEEVAIVVAADYSARTQRYPLGSVICPDASIEVTQILARILLNNLNGHLEKGLLPQSQCGFRRHRGTTDMVFAARQLQQKCQEMQVHLYATFVYLRKTFATVNREGVWKIMQKFGCPERSARMIRQLHDGMMTRVTNNGTISEAFAVTNGVKQGCVLVTTPFSLMLSAMLFDAYRDERPEIRIAYRTDGYFLNSRCMQAPTQLSETTVHNLLFVDDCALNARTEVDMQQSMDLFVAGCANFDLAIHTDKTVVMHQP